MNEHPTSNFQHPNNGNELQTSNFQSQNNCETTNQNIQKRKVFDIRERLYLFSMRILQICRNLPISSECEVVRRQLSKSGTSIGANFEEADGSLTKKDFINKVAIARKEAKKTKYWLRLISDNYVEKTKIEDDIRENEELICILSAILKKAGYKSRF